MSKPVYILGLSAFYHDSAACLLKDGEIIAAVQEERFTRIKHDHQFPKQSIDYCLSKAGITVQDVDCVAFYEKPFLKFERLLLTYISYAPFGLLSFLKAMPQWIKIKLFLKDYIERELDFKGEVLFCEHHESHASSAFYPSPFQDAAILTLDGVGEWSTTSYGIGEGKNMTLLGDLSFPHSLGLLYSAFTYYTGFRVNSGEYKLMGLAPYGEPRYVDLIKDNLIDIKEDGSFKLDMSYFNYCVGLRMTNNKFHNLFGAPPRKPESEITQRDMDIARSIQVVTEELMLKITKHVHKTTGKKNLCLAGGVSLNCVGNGKILRDGPFENVWIQPAAGDAGGALGSALYMWYKYLDNDRNVDQVRDLQKGSYLGPDFSDEEIEAFLNEHNVISEKYDDQALANCVAELIDQQNVIGLFLGRMEYGPRALGARSIIADPRSEEMQTKLNLKIKFRESFRPFAPSVLESRVSDFFDLNAKSPYMLLVAPVHKNQLVDQKDGEEANGLGKLKVKRSTIPAITHVDCSARVQTVNEENNPLYYKIIKAFEERTGCPVIINTSFNVRGEPIVCTPYEAYRCFMKTNMDYLILGNYVIGKVGQKNQEQFAKEEVSLILD